MTYFIILEKKWIRLHNCVFNLIINNISFESNYYQYNKRNSTILLYVWYDKILEKMLNHNKSNLTDSDRILSNSEKNYENEKNNKISSILVKILKCKEIKID